MKQYTFGIKSYDEVLMGKHLVPEPNICRVEIDYGDAGSWKRTWMYVKTPNLFKIVNDWKITLPNEQQVMVPAGFVYDGASIPFFLQPLITSFGPAHRGSILHDYGYRYNYLLDWDGNKIYVGAGQKFFDGLFREVVAVTSHLKGLATIVWLGVRAFGKTAWNKRRKEQKDMEEYAIQNT